MERLTNTNSDYCHDICGHAKSCRRLSVGEKLCRDYDLYERLKYYEDKEEGIDI